jgi:hypothetical protein
MSLPNLARFKRWYTYTSTSAVYSQPSSIAVSRSYSGSVSENRTASMKPPNAQSPFAQHRHYPLLEDVRSIPARTLLPGRRSYGLIRQSHLALLAFGYSPRTRSLRRLLPAPAANGIFPTLSLRILPRMPGPLRRRYHGVHIPVSSSVSSAFPMK